MTENYIASILPQYLNEYVTSSLEEVRIRKNKPVIFVYSDTEKVTDKIYYRDDIRDFIDCITKSSVYSYYDDMANGFITVTGGHRVGICGSAVYENNELTAIKDITGINIRIAKEIKGVGEGVFSKICSNGNIENTLIISPPGMGKTTLLRDLTRLISDNVKKSRVALIDERNEVSATFMGNAQNDVGIRTDVFCGYKKSDGIIRAVRSMSPTVIAVDELGGKEDCKAVLRCFYSGVKIIATMHGKDVDDVKNNLSDLMEKNVFKYYVILGKKDRYERVCNIESVDSL